MGCQCSQRTTPARYVHVAPDGRTTTYASKTEAQLAAARKGGTWKVEQPAK